jgi:hypothetical protein
MSSPRSQELMNKDSQGEFRFTSQGGLQIACARWQSRPGARCRPIHERPLLFPNSSAHDFYERGRHEMLSELNCGWVRTNILVWLSSVLHDQSRNREALWPR